MEDLYKEMEQFLKERDITTIILEKSSWFHFVQLLVKVLENRPISNPTNGVILFSFIPAAERCVQGIIKFQQPIRGHHHYKFGNVF